ncbi:o-succinylbenzoate synthase [Belliella aquatica]|uniref:O-succinylbenzoate synthase n=1 Tax=Belliella aquatica TaxID=1323734 RepID=A0ABQ1N472_9BACT|nr:o-succinylbenzoate synthase [Belliella aquatica]MCH7406769.1 o-succinylbenzoate synthase [Belliella aquatica]GGC48640.1 o-succinylbenzoate synthase [Belliella aquatica]
MSKTEQLFFECKKHVLDFKFDAGTSRGVLKQKETYFVTVRSRSNSQGFYGIGEAGPLPNLSLDDLPDFEDQLMKICNDLSSTEIELDQTHIFDFVNKNISGSLPSIRFAFESALLDYSNGGKRLIFDSDFVSKREPISINGLIWMGEKDFMLEQIDKKLQDGYDCIKMKIGAIDFDQECDLLAYIRSKFDKNQITLRVDANGAFTPDEAFEKLKRLAEFDLHSIEQPIRQGQVSAMSRLCEVTPIAIALDEELIGVFGQENKKSLLQQINPQYIILKPTLLGGFRETKEWIDIAERLNITWWMTSALESNIGLNAISQFTATFETSLPQGLGTGQLYHNNIESPLVIESGTLVYEQNIPWSSI